MKMLGKRISVRLAAALIAGVAPGAMAQERLPIFDTHLHYSQSAWTEFPPASVVKLLDGAGVARGLVSSSPDDGSLALNRVDSDRFVPVLRPYRAGAGPGNWYNDRALIPYLEERLHGRHYAGIGEFHLYGDEWRDSPVVRRVVELAAERGIVLHVHSDAAPVRALFARDVRLRIFWAHAGMSEGPETVGAMLDAYPNLWTEVSFRAGEIAPGGTLAPAWRDLMLRHVDRFMIGSDTYTSGRWSNYAAIIAEHRRWLAQMPAEAARAIAYRNAVRLFGDGARKEFLD